MRFKVHQTLFLCAALAAIPVFAQEPAGFDVYESPPFLNPPDNTQIGIANTEIRYMMGSAAQDIEEEKFLNNAYKSLRKAGYGIPPISPRTTYADSGERQYRVFKFDFKSYRVEDLWDDSDLGMLVQEFDCGDVEPGRSRSSLKNWIAINSGMSSEPASYRFMVYSHELFHGFQDAYDLFTVRCAPSWVSEGLADAAGNFLAEHYFPGAKPRLGDYDRVSLRSYRIAFQDTEDWIDDPYFKKSVLPKWSNYNPKGGKNNLSELGSVVDAFGYHTSGFWQFLARRSAGKKAKDSSPEEIARLLGSWLPFFKNSPPGHVDSRVGWMRLVSDFVEDDVWLENKHENNALYAWLPEFFTEYATWWDERHPHLKNTEENWLDRAFGGCETVSLKPGRTAARSTKSITLKNFRKTSARCIKVNLKGFKNAVNIKVKADYKKPGRADQLHLGLARIEAPGGSGKKVSSCWDHWMSDRLECRRLGKVSEADLTKTWKSEQFSSETLELPEGQVDATLTYIFSNVAIKAQYTKTIEELELTISAINAFGGDKNFAPPNSIRPQDPKQLSQIMSPDMAKQTFYRLYTSPPFGLPGLFPIELNEIKDGEQPRCGGDEKNRQCAYDTGGDYYIRPASGVSFGQTGRIHATVHKNPNGGLALMSTYCTPDADLKAVEILDSSEEGLVLRVNSDLCEIPNPGNDFCNKQLTCPVRDHILTTLTLGLGREHFGETAPVHNITPGTRFDIDLYFRHGVPTQPLSSPSIPGTSASSSAPGSASASPGTGTTPGGSSNTGGTLENCTCTCDERENTLQQAEDLKAREQAGDNIPASAFMELMACSSACQTEYMLCELEKNKTIESEKETQGQARSDKSCDCSCEALESMEQQTALLLERFQSGDQGAMNDMQRLGQCVSVCQNELQACMMK